MRTGNLSAITRVPLIHYIKVGYKGVYISRTCYSDVTEYVMLGAMRIVPLNSSTA